MVISPFKTSSSSHTASDFAMNGSVVFLIGVLHAIHVLRLQLFTLWIAERGSKPPSGVISQMSLFPDSSFLFCFEVMGKTHNTLCCYRGSSQF